MSVFKVLKFIARLTRLDQLPRPVIDFLIYIFYYRFYRRSYCAQNGLDRKLKKYLNYDGGFFVELGANDGFTGSNTFYFDRKKKWSGVLVEPVMTEFLSCVYFRSKPGNHIFCNACVPFGFPEKYVDLNFFRLMSFSGNLATDIDEEFVSRAKKCQYGDLEIKFGAPAVTLSSILDKSNAPDVIDLLSLDVEGAEFPVLEGIDFNKYTFKYLLVECRSIDRVDRFLKDRGYVFIEKMSHHDYLYAYPL